MRWSDPTDCLTEAEERKIEEAHHSRLLDNWFAEMDAAFDALVDGIDSAAAEHSAYLAKLASEPLIDPDLEAMITRPAATVAGSVSLLDAVNARKVAA